VSESPASSPSSSPRPFDFAELGRPVPKSVRALPNVPDADASGALEELSADDILESDDIDALEAAAADISSFEAPPPPSSGFEVGELGSFDDVEVEGLAARATEPAPASVPAPNAVITNIAAAYLPAPAPVVAAPATIEAAPVSMKVEYTSPHPTTLVGVPAAPNTSPLPLEESVIVSEPPVERTLEIRGNDMAKVAAAAAKLDAQPEQTEVLVRSAMPPALQHGAMPHSHSPAHAQGQPVHGRPSSIAPVALDVTELPRPARMPSVPAISAPIHMPSRAVAPKRGTSGLAIGAIVFAAVALVGLVGVGGYTASRALSDKAETASVAPSEPAAAAQAGAAPEATPAAEPAAAGSSPIDVSSLPSAPVPGAAPRGFTGSGSFVAPATPTPPPVVAASPAAAAAPAAAAPAGPANRSSGVSGGALPAPGSGSKAVTSTAAGAPLPPPASAPAAAPAPAAPAVVSTTGTVRVDPNLRAVVVDGSYRRPNDGVLTVSCGTHRIKAGMKEQQTVHVPCGGSVSL
jgi:hypothetical protein